MMASVIDMQTMRYLNLLDKVSQVKTRKCFVYNNTVFFAVNPRFVSKAIGPAAINIKKIHGQIGKRIKVVKEARGLEDCKRFIKDIVAPTTLKSLEIRDACVTITAGSNQNRAALIGRDKRRYEELRKIVQDVFHLDLKIV